ncbi:MAG: serine/threonine-protein kinase, partial [Candidatus Xenobia bacterium]
QGLEAIHAAGVIHRDLKPQNIFLANDGLVKIMDFGIARKQGYRTITTTGMSFATPSFISPEQLTDAKTVDNRTDLFNTGMILYQMLTRRMPFEAPTLSATVKNVIAGVVPPLANVRSDLPPELEPWMLRLLYKNREQRFASAREAIDAINF